MPHWPRHMMQKAVFPVVGIWDFKYRALSWANQKEILCMLDSNGHRRDPFHRYDALLAVGAQASIQANTQAFDKLKDFHETHQDWIFGCLSYDLKNHTEKLSSENSNHFPIPDLYFFKAEILLIFKNNLLEIHSCFESPETIFNTILKTKLPKLVEDMNLGLKARMNKENYLGKVKKIKDHIIEGDIYEMNFCQEFYAENTSLDPLELYIRLNTVSSSPFASFFKLKDQYLLSASPERFIQKNGQELYSQPIKGTRPRGANKTEDEQLKKDLANSIKDQAENVMIVDLVRNDFARTCQPGSVKVDELFGIYSFEQVHHMISTVRGTLREDVHFVDALKACFPMGSMTGAPKIKSMELIEKYETVKRNWYSGSVGYISPEGNFDFNVIIRSILYSSQTKYLSFQTGGAIVYDSVPEDEYEECLLKAKGIMRVTRQIQWPPPNPDGA